MSDRRACCCGAGVELLLVLVLLVVLLVVLPLLLARQFLYPRRRIRDRSENVASAAHSARRRCEYIKARCKHGSSVRGHVVHEREGWRWGRDVARTCTLSYGGSTPWSIIAPLAPGRESFHLSAMDVLPMLRNPMSTIICASAQSFTCARGDGSR